MNEMRPDGPTTTGNKRSPNVAAARGDTVTLPGGRPDKPNSEGREGRRTLPECKAHGLRKALMRQLAEQGATVKELASVAGHKSLTEIERYTRNAEQKMLSSAAIAKLTAKGEK